MEFGLGFWDTMEPCDKAANCVVGYPTGHKIKIMEGCDNSSVWFNSTDIANYLVQDKKWTPTFQHIMKEEHFIEEQGYVIGKAEAAYKTRLFALNESIMLLKRKLTYVSLEFTIMIAKAAKISRKVDWAKLIFSNLIRFL